MAGGMLKSENQPTNPNETEVADSVDDPLLLYLLQSCLASDFWIHHFCLGSHCHNFLSSMILHKHSRPGLSHCGFSVYPMGGLQGQTTKTACSWMFMSLWLGHLRMITNKKSKLPSMSGVITTNKIKEKLHTTWI